MVVVVVMYDCPALFLLKARPGDTVLRVDTCNSLLYDGGGDADLKDDCEPLLKVEGGGLADLGGGGGLADLGGGGGLADRPKF